MKIYISGKITGLPYAEVKTKFEKVEKMLLCLGYQAVSPLRNGLALNASWNKHMARDIEMLLGCDAIIMLEDWKDSKGAIIEYSIASITGIRIHDVTNIHFEETWN